MYGRRAAPYQVLSEFSERVGETYATEDVLPRMARILAEGTGADRRAGLAAGRRRAPHRGRVAGGAPGRDAVSLRGEELPDDRRGDLVEVRDRGELLGALSVAMPASDPMNPSKERLIRDLAAQAGLVLRNVRLIQELRASRQRLVAAQDEERRKLERDLHDGAQQQLVALSVQLKLAQDDARRDPATVGGMLDTLQTGRRRARRPARPRARDLPAAARRPGSRGGARGAGDQVGGPDLRRADGVGRYPREVEAAVYFCTASRR